MMMRKMMVLALGLAMTVSGVGFSATAAAESKPAPVPVGTVVGQVLSTDITAWINGKSIPSMNIGGHTAVAAEDLRRYGFDVGWVPSERKVIISYRAGKPVAPLPVEPAAEMTGYPIGQVLTTDITAYYGKVQIPSFNIGGRTAVVLKDLAPFGNLEWKAKERMATFTHASGEPANDPLRGEDPLLIQEGGTVELKGIEIHEGSVIYQDGEIGFVQDGNSYLEVNWLLRQLGYKLEVEGDGVYTVSNGSYSFRIRSGDPLVRLYWFGVPVGSKELLTPPVWFDDKLQMRETDLQEVFGYQSNWDPQTRLLDIRYIGYIVTDYGLPGEWNRYGFQLGATAYMNGAGGTLPMLRLTRLNENGVSVGGGSSLGLEEEAASGMMPKYSLKADLQTDIGRNDIGVTVSVGSRLLYAKELIYDLHMADMDPIIRYTNSEGLEWNRILGFEAPSDSYTLTGESRLEIKGTVEKAVGKGMNFLVEKQDHETGAYEEAAKGQVVFAGNAFTGKAELTGGEGLYRITLYSFRVTPRGDFQIPVAILYARYTPR